MRLIDQSLRRASGRQRLLTSCASTAVLASLVAVPLVLLSGTVGSEARADDGTPCGTTGNSCGIIFQGQAGQDQTGTHDGNGIGGGAGQSASGDVSHTFTPDAQQTYTDAGASYAIGLQSSGGRGGNGSDADKNDFGISDKRGGAGGTGGNAGNLSLTIDPGVIAQGTANLAIYMLTLSGSGGRPACPASPTRCSTPAEARAPQAPSRRSLTAR